MNTNQADNPKAIVLSIGDGDTIRVRQADKALTDQPSSVSSKRILNNSAGSSLFLEPRQIHPKRSNSQRSSNRTRGMPMARTFQ